jgi:uncharacterized membrane protein
VSQPAVIGSRPSGSGDRAVFAAFLVAVGIFVVVGAGRPIWQDEAATILIAERPFRGIVDGLRHENNFPAYFFLLSIWMRLAGTSEIALRALSAIFYLAGGMVVFALGKRVSSTARGAWYSSILYLCSPLAIRQAQNIRMYSLVGFLTALSVLLFIRIFFDRHPSGKTKAFFVVVNSIGILTQLWFGFVLVGQLVAVRLFARRRFREWLLAAVVAGIPFVVLWGSAFLDQIHGGATDWMANHAKRRLLHLPLDFYGLIFGAALSGAAVFAWVAARRARRAELFRSRLIPLMAVLVAVSLACPVLISFVKPIYYPGRYTIIALPPLAVLLAGLLSTRLPRFVLPLICVPLLALGVVNQVRHRDEVPEAQLPPGQSDRSTAQFLLKQAVSGDAIVFTSLTRPAADYYFQRAHAVGHFVEISFPAEDAAHPGWDDTEAEPQRRAALDAEAAALTRQLSRIAASGRKIWFYDAGEPVGDLLRKHLDASLTRAADHPLSGPYHKRILEYGRTTVILVTLPRL